MALDTNVECAKTLISASNVSTCQVQATDTHSIRSLTPVSLLLIIGKIINSKSLMIPGGAAVFAGRPGRKTIQNQLIRESAPNNGSGSIGMINSHLQIPQDSTGFVF